MNHSIFNQSQYWPNYNLLQEFINFKLILGMEDDNKEGKINIMNNRNRMRTEAKIMFKNFGDVGHSQEPKSAATSPGNESDQAKKLANRKKSQDLSAIESKHKTKEIIVFISFFDLFDLDDKKLGQGAQSVVKRCRQKQTGKEFAVKLFRKCDQQLLTNLMTQYKILKSLTHKNIIEAHYLFVNKKESSAQLVMELCSYQELRHYMRAQTILPEQTTAYIIRKLLVTLAYVHEKGICHRDVKPQNTLYDPETLGIKLIDFEISKYFKTKSGTASMWTKTGTLHYKAPEMFSGSYSENVDVWAIGVMTYEMLTGKLPFQFQFTKDAEANINNHEPEYGENISVFAQCFIKKCLTKDPNKRPKSIDILSCPFLLVGNVHIPSPKGSKFKHIRSLSDKTWGVEEQGFMVLSKCDQSDEDNMTGNDIGIRVIHNPNSIEFD